MHFRSQETGVLQLENGEVPYRICRSVRRWRTISLSFEHNGLRLMVPLHTSSRRIQRLLAERTPWIQKRLRYLSRVERLNPADEYKDGALIPYLGQTYRLQISYQKGRARCALEAGVLRVTAENEAKACRAILNWYRDQAGFVLAERIQPLARQLGVRHGRLSITNARRLWGSCTARNDIRINWRIMMAPLPLVDCLLAHELCHIVHRNHSRKFWALLQSLIPDQSARKKQLRELEADLLRRGRSLPG